MRSIPVWSITDASNPERESQLQTTYSPKTPTIFVWRVPFSTLRLMVAPSYRESGPAGGHEVGANPRVPGPQECLLRMCSAGSFPNRRPPKTQHRPQSIQKPELAVYY